MAHTATPARHAAPRLCWLLVLQAKAYYCHNTSYDTQKNRYNVNAVNSALIVLALLIAVGVIYAISQRVHAQRASRRSIDERRRITCEIVNTAIDQRSTFRLEVQEGELKGYKTEGICVHMTDMWLVLDVGGAFATNQWEGEEVLVFFQTSFKRKPSFYQFRGIIGGVHRRMQNTMLRLPIPDYLEPGQKRSFLRITPQHSAVLGIGLWPISDRAPLPISAEKLPPPLLNYRPGKSELLTMDNLSAGGARLGVDKSIDLRAMVDLDKGSQILCLLVLKNIGEGKRPLAFWLACTVTGFTKTDSAVNYLGVRFTNWAVMESGKDQIRWFPLSKDRSVAPLATWVMRHHLEQSKMT